MYKEINLNNIKLEYALKEDPTLNIKQTESYEQMKTLLHDVGIDLDICQNRLVLQINPKDYIRTRSRNAGRKVQYDYTDELYCYSDVIAMLQHMTDKDIMKQLNMTHATYYRHKKQMLHSAYYQALDKERLHDISYLKSVRYDFFF